MEFKKPERKKNAPEHKNFCLPLQTEKKHVGVFNGQNVTVSDWDSMNSLYYWGFFGKGSLSKAAPTYHLKKDDLPKIVTEDEFQNLTKWNVNIHYSSSEKYSGGWKNYMELSISSVNNFLKFVFNDERKEESWQTWKKTQQEEVLKDVKNDNKSLPNILPLLEFNSDEDYVDSSFSEMVGDILKAKQGREMKFIERKTEEVIVVDNPDTNKDNQSLSNVNARLEEVSYLAEENLELSLEESFFLNFATGCLKILDLDQCELSTSDLWEKFNAAENDFLERYIIYHYYRAKGWIVKSGLKYGGDFLLYKDGPAYYHATYVIQIVRRGMELTWREFVGRTRLVETYNKDLVLCEVEPLDPSIDKTPFPDCLKNYIVREVLVRRWVPSKERFSQEEGTS